MNRSCNLLALCTIVLVTACEGDKADDDGAIDAEDVIGDNHHADVIGFEVAPLGPGPQNYWSWTHTCVAPVMLTGSSKDGVRVYAYHVGYMSDSALIASEAAIDDLKVSELSCYVGDDGVLSPTYHTYSGNADGICWDRTYKDFHADDAWLIEDLAYEFVTDIVNEGAAPYLVELYADKNPPYSAPTANDHQIWGGGTGLTHDSFYDYTVGRQVTWLDQVYHVVELGSEWTLALPAVGEHGVSISGNVNGDLASQVTLAEGTCDAYAVTVHGNQVEALPPAHDGIYVMVIGWQEGYPGLVLAGGNYNSGNAPTEDPDATSTGSTVGTTGSVPVLTPYKTSKRLLYVPTGHERRMVNDHDGSSSSAIPLWGVHHGGDPNHVAGTVKTVSVDDGGSFDAIALSYLDSEGILTWARLSEGDTWDAPESLGGYVLSDQLRLWGLMDKGDGVEDDISLLDLASVTVTGDGTDLDTFLDWYDEMTGETTYRVDPYTLGTLGTLASSLGIVSEDAALLLTLKEDELCSQGDDPVCVSSPTLYARLPSGANIGYPLHDDGLGGYTFDTHNPVDGSSVSGHVFMSDDAIQVSELTFEGYEMNLEGLSVWADRR